MEIDEYVHRMGGVANWGRLLEHFPAAQVRTAAALPRPRIDFRSLMPGEARPDRFVCRFSYASVETRVNEPALTEDLRHLARIVLEE